MLVYTAQWAAMMGLCVGETAVEGDTVVFFLGRDGLRVNVDQQTLHVLLHAKIPANTACFAF